jgi:hypothetical protein
MRLPVVPQISTKDGVSNKNARLTNCLKESKKSGDKAVVRPGLVLDDTYSGIGNGLIPFDGRLLTIYDDTVYDTEADSLPWPLDSADWAAGTTYYYGDFVWYNGMGWFSGFDSNVGNTPGSSAQWSTSVIQDTYAAGTTYGLGDSVVYKGVTYYSYRTANVGNTPNTSDFWETTPPPYSYRWTWAPAPGNNCISPGASSVSGEAFGSADSALADYVIRLNASSTCTNSGNLVYTMTGGLVCTVQITPPYDYGCSYPTFFTLTPV